MAGPPSPNIVNAIETGVATISRRCSIFESDGVTPWTPGSDSRLITGSVGVDYSRDERRTLDLTLRNDDGLLRPNAFGGLWYDKVIKVYRGISYSASAFQPHIAVVEASPGVATVVAYLKTLGFTDVTDMTAAVNASDLVSYDLVVAWSGTAATAKASLLSALYTLGKSVITLGNGNTAATVPLIGTTSAATQTWTINPVTVDSPLAGGWVAETVASSSAGTKITAIGAAVAVATGSGSDYTVVYGLNGAGGRWIHFQLPSASTTNVRIIMTKAINYAGHQGETITWETQLGEFCIDSLKDSNFPYQVIIAGRDYTKRMLLSKLETAATFVSGTSVKTLITALAANSGIVKMNLGNMPETLTSDLSFDRGTDRWSIAKQAANSFNYEIFFDATGTLVTRKFIDPTLGAISMTFQTGSKGNLVSYTRTTNDSRLYNDVCVYGDQGTDTSALPFFGQAKNTNPSSPTRISRIGDRFYSFASSFFTSDQQCADYAASLLKVVALETYEMDMASIYYPWMEVGEIARIIDPDALIQDPDRFLIDTITYPLELGPMTWTGKRVTYVGV